MRSNQRAALGAALGAIGLAACEPASPPGAVVSPPVEKQAIAAPSRIAPAEALLELVREEDPYSRALRLGALLPMLGPEAVPLVKEIIRDPRLYLRATDLELLLRFWATHEPTEASRWALVKSPKAYRVAAIVSTFEPWAEADPHAARRASEQRVAQVGDAHNAVQMALVRGWYRADPEGLAQYIQQLGVGFARLRALSTFLREMVQDQGADAAVRWAEAISDDDDAWKTAVYRQLGSALALFDHDAAMRWCEAHCDGPFGNNLRNIIATIWVSVDGPASLAWLSGAPEGHERDMGVRHAFDAWGRRDRAAALAWMGDQTASGEMAAWLRPALPVYTRLLSSRWSRPRARGIGPTRPPQRPG
jgi:hypothetical protein